VAYARGRTLASHGQLFGPGLVDSGSASPSADLTVRLTQLVVAVIQGRTLPTPTPVPDPDGDGEVDPGTNPAAGGSICGSETIVRWWELEQDASPLLIHRYSDAPVNIDEPIEARVERFGVIRRSLANAFSQIQGSTVSTVWNDHDGALRAMEATDSIVGLRASAYVSSVEDIRAYKASGLDANKPRRVFDGIVLNAKPLGGRSFELWVMDYLSRLLEQFSTVLGPTRVFNLEDFPNMGNPGGDVVNPGNPTMVGKSVPVGYGLLSDESSETPQGVVPGIFVGQRIIDDFPWDEYVFFGHASSGFQSLFIPEGPGLSVGTTYPSRIKIDASSGFVDYMMPGDPLYTAALGSTPHQVYNGNTYFSVFGRGPRSLLNREGKVPLLANLGGADENGDGTGATITGLFRQILHALNNWYFDTYTSGAWLSAPTVGTGAELYSRIDTSSFEALQAFTNYNGAFLLGHDGKGWSLDTFLTHAMTNGNFRIGVNKDGQIVAKKRSASLDINRTLTWQHDVLKQSPGLNQISSLKSERKRDLVRNVAVSRYARRYSPPLAQGTPEEGALLPVSNTEKNPDWLVEVPRTESPNFAASRSQYGEKPVELNFELVREEATHDAVVAEVLEENEVPPLHTEFKEGPCGTDSDLGDLDALTHYEQITEDERLIWCEEHALDLDSMEVTRRCWDVTTLNEGAS
jgi:hypothetical protein